MDLRHQIQEVQNKILSPEHENKYRNWHSKRPSVSPHSIDNVWRCKVHLLLSLGGWKDVMPVIYQMVSIYTRQTLAKHRNIVIVLLVEGCPMHHQESNTFLGWVTWVSCWECSRYKFPQKLIVLYEIGRQVTAGRWLRRGDKNEPTGGASLNGSKY